MFGQRKHRLACASGGGLPNTHKPANGSAAATRSCAAGAASAFHLGTGAGWGVLATGTTGPQRLARGSRSPCKLCWGLFWNAEGVVRAAGALRCHLQVGDWETERLGDWEKLRRRG